MRARQSMDPPSQKLWKQLQVLFRQGVVLTQGVQGNSFKLFDRRDWGIGLKPAASHCPLPPFYQERGGRMPRTTCRQEAPHKCCVDEETTDDGDEWKQQSIISKCGVCHLLEVLQSL